jgi:hypothetical protein
MTPYHFPSFLLRPTLLPGEALASFFVRLSILNAYPSVNMVNHVGREYLLQKDELTRPMYAETYQVLQQLTKLTPLELYQATPQLFAAVFSLPGPGTTQLSLSLPDGESVPSLKTKVLQHHLWSSYNVCYCPLCLQESAHYRLVWMPRAVATCLVHRCLLVRGCQACNHPLQVPDVVMGYCPGCRFDLSQATTPTIIEDSFGLFTQETFLNWFGGSQEVSPPVVNELKDSWDRWAGSMPKCSVSVLYHFVDALQRSLFRVRSEWTYWHLPNSRFPEDDGQLSRLSIKTLAPEISYILFATAFKALVSWPDGFYEFLDAYQQRNGRQAKNYLVRDFGSVCSVCLANRWVSPYFQFVQEAFNQYLIEKRPLH